MDQAEREKLTKSQMVAMRREARFEAGLCILCGKRPHMLDHRGCVECLEKQILRQRALRARRSKAEADVAAICFDPQPTEEVAVLA